MSKKNENIFFYRDGAFLFSEVYTMACTQENKGLLKSLKIKRKNEVTRAVPKVRGHDLIMLFLEYYSNKFFILR